MTPMRFERTTFRLGGGCSIQLSYGIGLDTAAKQQRIERTTFQLGKTRKRF